MLEKQHTKEETVVTKNQGKVTYLRNVRRFQMKTSFQELSPVWITMRFQIIS